MADDGAVNLRPAVPLTSAFVILAAAVPIAHAEPPNPLYVLVDTAAQRLATADPVAAFKWIDGGPITDTPRAQQVLDAVGADAGIHRIDPGYVRRAFGDQIDATEGIEYTRFGQWKFDPQSAPSIAPDLSASRAAIDGFNKIMVTEMATNWDELHAPGCAADLDAARGEVGTARSLDPLYTQALTFATRSYCR
jgi:chorismate mutase